MGIPNHLTCLLRNLYAEQDSTVRAGHGTTESFKIGKEVHQSCILSPCLFNFYVEYIMWNAGLDESQAGIKAAGRNINKPYGCKSWIIKMAEHQRIDAFKLWCWRRLFRVPGTARKSNQSTLKDINNGYSLKGLMLKLQYFGHLMWRANSWK